MADKEQTLLTYKGRPLVRSGNTLYYGYASDACIVMLQILSTKDENDIKLATKVQIQLISTDPELPPTERILKKSEKAGLYEAMDIGSIWLERELSKQ